jgi:hypothetical protein
MRLGRSQSRNVRCEEEKHLFLPEIGPRSLGRPVRSKVTTLNGLSRILTRRRFDSELDYGLLSSQRPGGYQTAYGMSPGGLSPPPPEISRRRWRQPLTSFRSGRIYNSRMVTPSTRASITILGLPSSQCGRQTPEFRRNFQPPPSGYKCKLCGGKTTRILGRDISSLLSIFLH